MCRLGFRKNALRVALLFAAAALPRTTLRAQSTAPSETIEIDVAARTHPFPHFWEKMFGSGRAILSLRESYRHDLGETKRITGFEYVRFHAIFHDEAGFYDEDKDGKPVYNFSYVDQIYDGLLENHVRPFIELSFTPKKLASDPNALHAFWYKQNVSPPKDWGKWEQLVENFTRHLVERYGVDGSSRISRGISSSATASMKSRSGISKCGTSPTLISGPVIRKRPLTTSYTIAPRAPSSA